MQLADTKRCWSLKHRQSQTDKELSGSREPRTTKLFVLVPETNIEIQKKSKNTTSHFLKKLESKRAVQKL